MVNLSKEDQTKVILFFVDRDVNLLQFIGLCCL